MSEESLKLWQGVERPSDVSILLKSYINVKPNKPDLQRKLLLGNGTSMTNLSILNAAGPLFWIQQLVAVDVEPLHVVLHLGHPESRVWIYPSLQPPLSPPNWPPTC